MTRLLTRADVERLLEPAALLPKLREGFKAYSLGRTVPAQRASSPLPGRNASATVLFPGLLPHIPAYTAKVHAKFPGQDPGHPRSHSASRPPHGRAPRGDGVGALDRRAHSRSRGAVAADVLAREDAARVAVVGAGGAGRVGAAGVKAGAPFGAGERFTTPRPLRPGFSCGAWPGRFPPNSCPPTGSPRRSRDADIIVTATWSTSPFLFPGMVAEGAHVTTLGADEPGKAEVSAELIETSRFFCDDRDLTLTTGALGNVGLGSGDIQAELGEVIAGVKAGRTSADDLTIYGGVGLAWQDLMVAWEVFEKAEARGVGLELDFLA